MKTSKAYSRQVFLNCPFDDGYRPIYEAIIFAVLHCGFVIRCARERDDSGETRIGKIVEIIRESQFGIHDISRVECDEVNGLPRFNMPLELGLFLGAKSFSGEKQQKRKRCLILDSEPYRYQKFISDIAGQDIRSHGGVPLEALKQTRNCWRPSSTALCPVRWKRNDFTVIFKTTCPPFLGNWVCPRKMSNSSNM